MAVLAIDTIGHLPAMSKGNRWFMTPIYLHTSYVFAVPMKEKSAKNAIQAYLSGILAHKGGSVTILSDNGTEFKNKAVNEEHDQLGIKNLFSNPFHSKVTLKLENVHNFLKCTLTEFLESSDLGME